jgi:carbonic anhydrase
MAELNHHPGFAVAVNCIDGRVQEPVISFLKKKCDVEYVDVVTEAGPDRLLAESMDYDLVRSIYQRVEVSFRKHGSKHVAIVGHHDCAGNPVAKETHLSQIRASIQNLRMRHPEKNVLGLWVNENWEVEEVD